LVVVQLGGGHLLRPANAHQHHDDNSGQHVVVGGGSDAGPTISAAARRHFAEHFGRGGILLDKVKESIKLM
jgi:hypothetical protein